MNPTERANHPAAIRAAGGTLALVALLASGAPAQTRAVQVTGVPAPQSTPSAAIGDDAAAPLARSSDDAAAPLARSSAAKLRRLELAGPRFDASRWRERLADPDLDRREAAFSELVCELGRCGEAVRVLETWAASQTEPELSWTARLALRASQRVPQVLVFGRPAPAPSDAPRTLAIDLSDPARVDRGLRSLDALSRGVLFEAEAGLSLHAPRLVSFQAPPSAGARNYSLEIAPERVTLRITESSGGAARRRELSAASLDALLAENPRLRDEVPGLADMAVRLPRGLAAGSSLSLLRWGSGPVRLQVAPQGWNAAPGTISLHGILLGADEPPQHVLGVECQEVSAEERELRALEPGVGLRVERTIPGTLAHEVELHRGDILVRLDGRPLRTCEDIGATLAARDPKQSLVLGIVDTNGQARTIIWRPAD